MTTVIFHFLACHTLSKYVTSKCSYDIPNVACYFLDFCGATVRAAVLYGVSFAACERLASYLKITLKDNWCRSWNEGAADAAWYCKVTSDYAAARV